MSTTLNGIPGMLYSAAVALLGRDHGARVGVDGTEDQLTDSLQ